MTGSHADGQIEPLGGMGLHGDADLPRHGQVTLKQGLRSEGVLPAGQEPQQGAGRKQKRAMRVGQRQAERIRLENSLP